MRRLKQFIFSRHSLRLLAVLLLLCFASSDLFASTTPGKQLEVDAVICKMIIFMQDKVVKIICIIVIGSLGIGVLFGKTNWGLFICVVVGVAIATAPGVIMKGIFGFDPCATYYQAVQAS